MTQGTSKDGSLGRDSREENLGRYPHWSDNCGQQWTETLPGVGTRADVSLRANPGAVAETMTGAAGCGRGRDGRHVGNTVHIELGFGIWVIVIRFGRRLEESTSIE